MFPSRVRLMNNLAEIGNNVAEIVVARGQTEIFFDTKTVLKSGPAHRSKKYFWSLVMIQYSNISSFVSRQISRFNLPCEQWFLHRMLRETTARGVLTLSSLS